MKTDTVLIFTSWVGKIFIIFAWFYMIALLVTKAN